MAIKKNDLILFYLTPYSLIIQQGVEEISSIYFMSFEENSQRLML
jgi:hypothetical protein